jgi:ribosome modulation factor
MVAQNKYEVAFSHEYQKGIKQKEKEKKPYLTSSCFSKRSYQHEC